MALLAALEQRPRSALRLIGYANAAFARNGTPRQATEQAFIARADQLARAALVGTADALAADRWLAEGAALPDAALPALAFDAED
jgi:hypothetical protein